VLCRKEFEPRRRKSKDEGKSRVNSKGRDDGTGGEHELRLPRLPLHPSARSHALTCPLSPRSLLLVHPQLLHLAHRTPLAAQKLPPIPPTIST
jgi:hypothetical protein